ncbi:hypothetical protein [Acinetobacter higginsii]|uniref:hypothetical protein n=1 Tax=Acinetobacter higginsii TaxID=70347 RepID=UPI002675EDC3|nr:hypothetical protein [Acinetobacter higginsii]MDO3664501.1 hypothetical protein [Acinetobacter higginsii]
MLRYPNLAQCANRGVQSKINPIIGEPLEWLSNNTLQRFGYSQLSFDFFVNWNTYTFQNRIWIKRIWSSNISIDTLAVSGAEFLTQQAQNIGDNLALINQFSVTYNLDPSYIVFREVNWQDNPEPILRGAITANGIENIALYDINQVMQAIRNNSGGPVRIGSKALIYGTSCLECYLSGTDALWPGDVDIILWDNQQQRAVAIIELKKHTLNTAISEQQLSNYYPGADSRKYDRLALLRNHLGVNVPIIVLYYPTKEFHKEIKLEKIDGNPRELETVQSILINFQGLTQEMIGEAIIHQIVGML